LEHFEYLEDFANSYDYSDCTPEEIAHLKELEKSIERVFEPVPVVESVNLTIVVNDNDPEYLQEVTLKVFRQIRYYYGPDVSARIYFIFDDSGDDSDN